MESPRGLRVAGELDISNVSALAEALEEEIGAGEDVTLDLRDVTFVDSTGLQVLFRAARRLEGRGRLILVGPQPRVRTLFQYVLLDGRANVDIRDAS
jgi:anti-anti-sigma factor